MAYNVILHLQFKIQMESIHTFLEIRNLTTLKIEFYWK